MFAFLAHDPHVVSSFDDYAADRYRGHENKRAPSIRTWESSGTHK